MSRSIGQIIKDARELRKMTQEELAHKLRVGVHTLEKYESEEQNPSNETILKLSTVLDLPATALYNSLKHHTASSAADVKHSQYKRE
ncbi:helix-turn-helix transcriptional regulator [Neobacillus dielmonensis]|uniref:helix-turn-helix transcriptional regulator n=1 Tax=Neobacillus dielmonensis TaxID=1347369 RepID=UPI0005A5F34F|nr:helix-turn-helix transcriptional regulator [Neobacillus dielmonensis]